MNQINYIGSYSFDLYDKIGEGGFSYVYKGRNIHTSKDVAIKVIKLSDFRQYENHLKREIDIMKSISHKNVIELYDTYNKKLYSPNSTEYIYIVMELCDGGNLSHINKPVDEIIWRKYFRQIISGFQYLRSKNILHRDIKPENILLTKDGTIKIADFTLARFADKNDLMKTHCGTPRYMAPEMYDSELYNAKSDIWSLGILMYEYIYNCYPYGDVRNMFQLKKKLMDIDIEFPLTVAFQYINGNITKNLTLDCIDIMKQMLQKKSSERIDWSDLYTHPWIDIDDIENIKIESKYVSISAPINHIKPIPQKSLNKFIRPNIPSSKFEIGTSSSLLIPPSLILKSDEENLDISLNNSSNKSGELMFAFSPEDKTNLIKEHKHEYNIANKTVNINKNYFKYTKDDDLSDDLDNDDKDNDMNKNSITKTLSKSLDIVRQFFSI